MAAWDTAGNNAGATAFLGTTSAQPLRIRTNTTAPGQNVDKMIIATDGNVSIGAGAPTTGARLTVAGGDITWGNNSRLQTDQGGSIELGGDSNTPGTGTPYIDFHFSGLTQDYNTRIINDADGQLTIAANPIKWGNRSALQADQGGSIELGGDSNTPGTGTPYIDFHFHGLTQDFNTRIINDADGRLTVAANTLHASGDVEVTGDIRLLGADCAENFDVSEAETAEPGTVMVIDQEGTLKPSEQPYDKRVAGVVSGAGGLKPGIIFGKQEPNEGRLPIALIGKVACKVDAQYSPIEVGDLLAASPTPGYAMKAEDPLKASGAVIGKALQRLTGGRSLIPILVSLQ
jgi:hypothetical protein